MQSASPPPISPTRGAALRRDADDRIILGVCAGLGRTLNLSPTLARMAAVALGLTLPGVAVLAYAVMGAVVPRDDGRMALAGTPSDGRETAIAWIAAGVAAMVALTGGAMTSPLIHLDPTLLLVGAAAAAGALWGMRRRPQAGPATTPPAADGPPGGGPGPRGDAPTPPAPSAPPTDRMFANSEAATVVTSPPTLILPPSVSRTPHPDTGGGGATPDRPPDPNGPASHPPRSLLWLGTTMVALSLGALVMVDPLLGLGLSTRSTLLAVTAALGAICIGGVATAAALARHRHTGGLLVLSLAIGVVAVGLGSLGLGGDLPSQGESLARWILDRTRDLLSLNP